MKDYRIDVLKEFHQNTIHWGKYTSCWELCLPIASSDNFKFRHLIRSITSSFIFVAYENSSMNVLNRILNFDVQNIASVNAPGSENYLDDVSYSLNANFYIQTPLRIPVPLTFNDALIISFSYYNNKLFVQISVKFDLFFNYTVYTNQVVLSGPKDFILSTKEAATLNRNMLDSAFRKLESYSGGTLRQDGGGDLSEFASRYGYREEDTNKRLPQEGLPIIQELPIV